MGFPRGAVLARQGEFEHSFFILLDGSVEVVLERAGEPDEFIDVLGRGDCIGDLALLLGQERTATVRALRDCRAVHIAEDDFLWLLHASPDFTIQLARTIGSRLQRRTTRVKSARPIERIAAVAASANVDMAGFCRELEAGLAGEVNRAGRPSVCELLDAGGAAEVGAQATKSLRDADAVLFVGDAMHAPDTAGIGRLLDLLADFRPQPRLDLVLLHRTAPPFRDTVRWLRDRRLGWHHVEAGRQDDFHRLARRLMGRATGLVLSGGGARGFAHIGVLRAFHEAGIPIDFIAGSSMGAIVGGQHAMGLGTDEMIALMRRSYVQRGGLPDLAIPYVAIRTGTATDRQLRKMFGDTRIEDLRIPFFSVSSNLITAETVLHERGRLWHGVRSSCSVPGLLPPVRSRGGFLVDGGLLDNLPVGAMRARCAGRVVGSDVSVAVDIQMRDSARYKKRPFSALWPPSRMPGIGAILMRTAQLASVRDSRVAGIPADLYLHLPVDDVGMSDFVRLEEIVARGHEYARQKFAGWQR